MDAVLLLGDSITQQGYRSGWVSRISDALVRRAHVVNSGLSGYNSRWVLDTLRDPKRCEHVIPSWVREPLFVTLMLGSNDCAELSGHVPLPEFCENLRAIVELTLAKTNPKAGVFVMTPPPAHENVCNARWPDWPLYYSATRVYRQAVLRIAAELGAQYPGRVFAVDFQQAVLRYGDPAASEADMDVYDSRGAWTSLLVDDGLHLNTVGGALLSATVLNAVRRSPRGAEVLRNEEADWPLPDWKTVMAQSTRTTQKGDSSIGLSLAE